MPHSSDVDFLIVGAGITGLTIGYVLSGKGKSVRIVEKKERPGGAMQSIREGDWLAECGAGSILESSEHIKKLIEQLDLQEEQIISSPEAQKRYLVKNGKLSPVPDSILRFFGTELLSGKAKRSVLKEPFTKAEQFDDEALADFVRRRLDQELLDQFINPLVGGIYAGDPERLSVRHGFPRLQALEDQYGSLIKGQIRGLKKDPRRREIPRNKARAFSFRDGVQTLPEKLAEKTGASIEYKTGLRKLATSGSGFKAVLESDGNSKPIYANRVVMTLPAYALAEIPVNDEIDVWGDITQIPYAPVSVINLGYHKDSVQHPLDGFGVLIPQKENYRILGVQFNSTVFAGRAPENHVMLTVFLGGMRSPEQTQKSQSEQIEVTREDLNKLLGITSDPVFTRFTPWPKAIPQYEVGYQQYLDTMEKIESKYPGLHLAGNYRGGISVGDCITNAILTGEDL